METCDVLRALILRLEREYGAATAWPVTRLLAEALATLRALEQRVTEQAKERVVEEEKLNHDVQTV